MSGKIRLIRCVFALAMGLTAAPCPVWADDNAEVRAKMAELEGMQKQIQAQMDELRTQLGTPAPTAAAEPSRVDVVEEKQDVITAELRKLKEAMTLPEMPELKSKYGLGPAASKVYGVTQGLSIGGYGEFVYKNVVEDKGNASDQFDMLRLVLYTGYKFTDWLVFNSELEFEHGTTAKDGEVSVEFATLDFLLHEKINLRGGLVLLPMGFINEIHEPVFFHGNLRPQVEQQIIPSTWRAGGAGFFGELLPGLTYRTYAVTGLKATGFSSAGIRNGRQGGSNETAEDIAWVGRLDYNLYDMLTLGGSAYVGNSGQGKSYGNAMSGYSKSDVLTQIYETHAQLRTHGFEARLLGAWIELDDAAQLSRDAQINPAITDPTAMDQPVASSQYGWYGEIAYDLMPHLLKGTEQYLAPWLRYSQFNTQQDVPTGFAPDDFYDRQIFEVGLSYKPFSQVVLKLDYRRQDAKSGSLPDEVRLGAGFVF